MSPLLSRDNMWLSLAKKGSDQLSYYTIKHRYAVCPQWQEKVVILAKYHYSDNAESPYLARFVNAECEIVENLRLPQAKQSKRLELFRYCSYDNCPCLDGFEEIIDTRQG